VAVDDGSTDGSLKIMQAFARQDRRVCVISRLQSGIVGALNDGLSIAESDFIARMDADDIAHSERFAAQLEFLADHPRCVAVGTDVLYTDPEGAPLVRHRPAITHEQILDQLFEGNGGALIHPSVMFRSKAIKRVGQYRERYQWIEDLDIYLRLSEIGELANLSNVYLQYRQHLKSVNRTHSKREDLRWELVNLHRGRCGLAAHRPQNGEREFPSSKAGWRRHWAYEGARGNHWLSARKNAWRALLLNPLDLKNWRCYRYVMGASPNYAERDRTKTFTIH
jgi:glycosyltransferase involved in cell wall biosynthesis